MKRTQLRLVAVEVLFWRVMGVLFLGHQYTAHPKMSEGINERGLDLLCPVYNILDFTRQGRGDWYASFDYPPKVQAARG